MTDKKTEPELSDAEKAADLARRQKGYVFMTADQVEEYRNHYGLRPLKHRHWMTRAKEEARLERLKIDRQERMRFLASGWKRLAKKIIDERRLVRSQFGY